MARTDWAARVRELSNELEQQYRIRLWDEIITPLVEEGLQPLTPGEIGLYKHKSFMELVEILRSRLGTDELFPIPLTCGAWFNTELDANTGKAFRFFQDCAFLELPIQSGDAFIEIGVAHAISTAAIEQLTVCLDGEKLNRSCVTKDAWQRDIITFKLSSTATGDSTAKLELSTTVSGIPALMHPNNNDWRRLSVAVFLPRACT